MKKNRFEIQDWKLKVKKSSAGCGLFAGVDIPKGVCLIEYFGRSISKEEQYTSRSKYLFEINSKITIDGRARENIARYINHSCKPNAEVEIKKAKASPLRGDARPIHSDNYPNGFRERIFIFSKKKIKAGEEICYDYGKEYFDEHIKKGGCRCFKCKIKKEK
ncbi:MAG: SET domain-containing protein [bacterium]